MCKNQTPGSGGLYSPSKPQAKADARQRGGKMKKITVILLLVFVFISAILGFSILRSHFTADKVQKYWDAGNEKNYMGDFEGAIEEYTKAIKLNPEYVPAYIGRANSENVMKKNKEAIKDCDSALWYAAKRNLTGSFFGFIAQLKEKDQWVKSLESVKIIEKDVMAPTYLLRGSIKVGMKDYKCARVDLDKSIKYNSDNAKAYSWRAVLEFDTGDNKGALIDLDKAISLDSKNVHYYGMRSDVKRKLGDNMGAMRDLDEVLKIKPSAMAYNNRADLKNTLGDFKGALKDINKALALEPKAPIPYCTRGEIESNLGNYSSAIKDFDKAIEFALDDEDTRKNAESGREKAAEKIKEIQAK